MSRSALVNVVVTAQLCFVAGWVRVLTTGVVANTDRHLGTTVFDHVPSDHQAIVSQRGRRRIAPSLILPAVWTGDREVLLLTLVATWILKYVVTDDDVLVG